METDTGTRNTQLAMGETVGLTPQIHTTQFQIHQPIHIAYHNTIVGLLKKLKQCTKVPTSVPCEPNSVDSLHDLPKLKNPGIPLTKMERTINPAVLSKGS